MVVFLDNRRGDPSEVEAPSIRRVSFVEINSIVHAQLIEQMSSPFASMFAKCRKFKRTTAHLPLSDKPFCICGL
jgi:hypothetical protein